MADNLTLDRLAPGESARVVSLASEGPERRRLLDLGFVPGAQIRASLRSPLGDPTAYEVRGALIALRREQAARITVEPLEVTADA
ncbi:MAG: hypothetical protein AMXMBFR61_17690 [Fimbriimonadales bacterium]